MTASVLKRFHSAHDAMARAVMPRTSAADPVPAPARSAVLLLASRGGLRLVKPLTFTLRDVWSDAGVAR